jgi:hypothetical protein
MSSWVVSSSPAEKYGGGFLAPQKATSDRSELPKVAAPSMSGGASPLSPSGALFWVGIIAAASVGLMAYSTTARVGPVSASLNLGK